MDGFLNIAKPAGMTSHDVVARLRRLLGRKRKVGHAGTLDPAAVGVLPLAIGRATRLIEYLADARKGYRALVVLGATTSTDDAEGEVLSRQPVPAIDTGELEQVLASFRGPIQQVPPMYSALHQGGKRLYELARAGETVERAPRPVTIYRLELPARGTEARSQFAWARIAAVSETALLALDIECSKGTYIRALARDIGVALGCGAHLGALQRSFVGPFHLETASELAELEQSPECLPEQLQAMTLAVQDWPQVQLDEAQARQMRNGQSLHLPQHSSERLRAHNAEGQLLGLLQRQNEDWRPLKVLLPDSDE
jgi:tRNA pseudouridine55 synthase